LHTCITFDKQYEITLVEWLTRGYKTSYLYLFTFTFTWGEGDHISGHPAMRPLHGPSAQPQQTSRSTEPLGSFIANFKTRNQWILLKVSITKWY